MSSAKRYAPPYTVVEIAPGGMHGRWSAIWEREGPNTWAVSPDPDLGLPERVYAGAAFGAVTFDAATTTCCVELRSRHGGVRTYSQPASSMDASRCALVDGIHRVRSNPMWVEGFDEIFGPADDLRPDPRPSDDYGLEWGDRLGAANNLHYEARDRPGSAIMKAVRGQRRLPLHWYVDEAARRFRDGTLNGTQVGVERVRDLMAWGYSCATRTLADLTDPCSGLSVPRRRAMLTDVADALVTGRLPSAFQVVTAWPARRRK